MKKVIAFFGVLFSLFAMSFSLFAQTAMAVCPVCTVAVIAGLGLSRYLGVDDTVSGIWIGALVLSSSFWLIDWLKKKYEKIAKLNNLSVNFPIITAMYLIVVIPLYLEKIIGHPFNKILGVDKLIAGMVIGSIVFLKGVWLDKKVRKIKGKQIFSYQKIVFPLSLLVISSLIMYFVTRH